MNAFFKKIVDIFSESETMVYLYKRVMLFIPTMIGITFLIFIITRMVPGGPIDIMLAQMQNSSLESSTSATASNAISISTDQLELLKKYYELDIPWWKSYFLWVKKIFLFDLGKSIRFNEPVLNLIASSIKISFAYGILVFFLIYTIGIPIGILKAIYNEAKLTPFLSIALFCIYSIPNYILGLGFIVVFSSWLDIFPLSGIVSSNFSSLPFKEKVLDIITHAILPITTYTLSAFPSISILLSSNLLDNRSMEYIKTALMKGMDIKTAILKHALKNSLLPIATTVGRNISIIVGGSFLIETIFNINGMGLLGYEALVNRDYPLVMGVLLISSFIFLIGNLLSDILVIWLDPRIKMGEVKR